MHSVAIKSRLMAPAQGHVRVVTRMVIITSMRDNSTRYLIIRATPVITGATTATATTKNKGRTGQHKRPGG